MHDYDKRSSQEHFTNLIQFRQAVYDHLGRAKDALFELGDANLQLGGIQSLAELSLAPVFRRKWPSVYEALQDSEPPRQEMMKLYLQQYPVEGERMILAGDHSAWSRLWAPTLEGRSYQHQSTPIEGRRPVTIGHGYSTLAIVPEKQGSWALPLLHQRITDQKPVAKGAEQLKQVCAVLPGRPISLWDSEYSCAAFVLATHETPADKLIRLRTNLVLEGPTRPYRGRGPKPTHGIPFKFRDPSTWWEPDTVWEGDDPDFGHLVVRLWTGLRFSKALGCPMTVALVERVHASGTRRKPHWIWFAWIGQEPPAQWWSLYARRYPIDHWYRFAKTRLHWTLPRLATPKQADRWSNLMPFLTWELWLARPIIRDCPLPWQKPLAHLPPGRVCLAFPALFPAIGTPARPCKSRGKAPGWPKGHPRTHRSTFELVRSAYWINKRAHQQPKDGPNPPKRGRRKKSSAPATA